MLIRFDSFIYRSSLLNIHDEEEEEEERREKRGGEKRDGDGDVIRYYRFIG
jgi:hypothetical protein